MASRYVVKPPLNAWIQSQRKLKEWKVEELSARLTELGHEALLDTTKRPPARRQGAHLARLSPDVV